MKLVIIALVFNFLLFLYIYCIYKLLIFSLHYLCFLLHCYSKIYMCTTSIKIIKIIIIIIIIINTNDHVELVNKSDGKTWASQPIKMREQLPPPPLFRYWCSPTFQKITHFAARIFLGLEVCLQPILLKI